MFLFVVFFSFLFWNYENTFSISIRIYFWKFSHRHLLAQVLHGTVWRELSLIHLLLYSVYDIWWARVRFSIRNARIYYFSLFCQTISMCSAQHVALPCVNLFGDNQKSFISDDVAFCASRPKKKENNRECVRLYAMILKIVNKSKSVRQTRRNNNKYHLLSHNQCTLIGWLVALCPPATL